MFIRGLAGALIIGGLFASTATAQTYVREVHPTPDQLNDNVRGQFIRAGDVSPEEYARLLREADKVRAYQGTSSHTYDYSYETQAVETPTYSTTEVYDGRPSYTGTTSQGYQIELYDTPVTVTASSSSVYDANYPAISSSHRVVKGDTLYSISKRYGVSLSELRSTNSISGNTISIGQVLSMPGQRREITQPYTINQSPTLIRNVEPIPFSGVYAVLPGDTLYSIARRACVGVEEISNANGLGSTTIVPGQRLSLPSGHCLQ